LIQSHYLQAITEGNFAFAVSIGLWGILAGALLLIALAFWFYRKTTRPLTLPWKTFFITLRACTLLLLGFCLLEPGVLVSEVVPQETYVAVLVDDSQSMTIADQPSLPSRHQQTVDLLYNEDAIIGRLSETFQVRTYKFSDVAQRLAGPEGLAQDGGRSAIAAGVRHVMGELSSFPMAGLVLVSDGADNADEDPLQSLQVLKEKQVPVYTVGVGAEDIDRDINIVDVNAAKSLLEGSVYTVQVNVGQQGYQGQQAKLSISSNGVEVAQQSVALADNGVVKRYTLELTPEKEEILVYKVAIEEKAGETIKQNNEQSFFIDNRRKKPLDVLYIEGQPRNEYKFIRRALDGEESLRLATYLQTGPRKYLRQGINSPNELESGFPLTAENLFKYEAIVFGNLSRSFFNDEQLELVKEFVAKRGGGFLMVGAIDEAFVDSALADALPVELLREMALPPHLQGGYRRGEHPTGAAFPVRLTRDGEYSPILRLDSDDKKNRELWRQMPTLEGTYVTGRAKPGASVLIEHPVLNYQGQALPVMTLQRYGAGRSMMLSTASTWRWQMLMSHEDQSHERLWRQWLRWLATGSQQRVAINIDRSAYNVGDTVDVSVQLLNEEFEPDNDGLLWLQVTNPDGDVNELPMTWQIDKEGTYVSSFEVDKEGVFDLNVKVPSDVDDNLQAQTPIIVTPSRREFLQASMDGGLLRRMAESSNGKFYTSRTVNQLVDDITFSPNAYSRQEIHTLWDQPLFLLLLLTLLCIEWFARRYKGLS
jgi:uncharacterized membrane protein